MKTECGCWAPVDLIADDCQYPALLEENAHLEARVAALGSNIERLEKQKELFYLILPDIQGMKMEIRDQQATISRLSAELEQARSMVKSDMQSVINLGELLKERETELDRAANIQFIGPEYPQSAPRARRLEADLFQVCDCAGSY
jgi:hypothetical protein